jgi:C4-dicarboxylate transporter, DctQ subunit
MKLDNWRIRIERIFEAFTDKLRWPAAALLFSMALLTAADVTGRYFKHSIQGNIDIQEYMMVLIVFLGVGYATLKERHANADIVVTRLRSRPRAVLGVVTWFICAVTAALLAWQMTGWGVREISSPTRASILLALVQWPAILVAAFGCILMCITSLLNTFRYLVRAMNRGSVPQ